MLKKFLLVLCLMALGAVASAGEPAMAPGAGTSVSPEVRQMVRSAIGRLSTNATIDSIEPAAAPGFYQVIASGQMLYVSADGKYLFNGDLLSLKQRKNLSDAAWAHFRQARLARLKPAQSIVFAPAHPKYKVTVFTDVTCGFCRQLHNQVEDFNKAGIAVQYVAWPREGLLTTAGRPTATYNEMVSVWCASDRKAAFTAAMDGHRPKPTSCANPVKQQYELGLELGVNGTPAVFGPDGRLMGGYLTAAQLLQKLRKDG